MLGGGEKGGSQLPGQAVGTGQGWSFTAPMVIRRMGFLFSIRGHTALVTPVGEEEERPFFHVRRRVWHVVSVSVA